MYLKAWGHSKDDVPTWRQGPFYLTPEQLEERREDELVPDRTVKNTEKGRVN
jgi:hypothetical protein